MDQVLAAVRTISDTLAVHGPCGRRRPATPEYGIVSSDTRVPPQRLGLWSTRSKAPTSSSATPRSWRSPTIWKAPASNGSTFPGGACSKPSAVPFGENETRPATRVRSEPKAPSGSQHRYQHPRANTSPHSTPRPRNPDGSSTADPSPTRRRGGVLPNGRADLEGVSALVLWQTLPPRTWSVPELTWFA